MNRSLTAANSDTCRITLDFAHEFYESFMQQGGTPAMLQEAQEHSDVMKRVVAAMNPNPTPLQALLRAIEIGVSESDGIYKYWDSGISIEDMIALPLLQDRLSIGFREKRDFSTCKWWHKKEKPAHRNLRLVVEGSNRRKKHRQQMALVSDDGIVPSARTMVMFFSLLYMDTGSLDFFLDSDREISLVRVSETYGRGKHLAVGHVRGSSEVGIGIAVESDDDASEYIAISELLSAEE